METSAWPACATPSYPESGSTLCFALSLARSHAPALPLSLVRLPHPSSNPLFASLSITRFNPLPLFSSRSSSLSISLSFPLSIIYLALRFTPISDWSACVLSLSLGLTSFENSCVTFSLSLSLSLSCTIVFRLLDFSLSHSLSRSLSLSLSLSLSPHTRVCIRWYRRFTHTCGRTHRHFVPSVLSRLPSLSRAYIPLHSILSFLFFFPVSFSFPLTRLSLLVALPVVWVTDGFRTLFLTVQSRRIRYENIRNGRELLLSFLSRIIIGLILENDEKSMSRYHGYLIGPQYSNHNHPV